VPVGELIDVAKPRNSLPGAFATKRDGASNDGAFDSRVEMISFRQQTSLLAESFRTTLTSILFSRRNGDRPRVLVLTSASPKEGKTTVVSNLSIAVAEIKPRVLVIDADMRRPRLHDIFQVENHLGLSNLLLERAPLEAARLDAACAPTQVPGLYLLPSGSSRAHASTLLHSERLPELLTLARERFDTVIIDTPPMVNIADARVLARLADALILVVRSGVTTRDAAQLATTRFAEDGTPVLGTILNFWNAKTPGYSYYKSYYAGYYHYYGDGNNNGKGNGNGNGNGNGGGGHVAGEGVDADRPVESPLWKPLDLRPQLGNTRATREGET
jgi:capsular exopolysaccharide synthesis family protein